ncbi:MAG: NlpC/P60 family protein [Actinomycetota bacterium]
MEGSLLRLEWWVKWVIVLLVALGLVYISVASTAFAGKPTQGAYTFQRTKSPAGTRVLDSTGKWVASFTDGSRTVALRGPTRIFSEATTPYSVTHSTWIRLLSEPFTGTVDQGWLTQSLADPSLDVLGVAMQYVAGAPDVLDNGLRIAGDASFGPLLADGTRQEGSDFNDYLGVSWDYPSTTDHPELDQLGSLDCSGFMRMVWGYRSGLPLALEPNGLELPRRAVQMHASAPGVIVIRNTGTQVVDLAKLQIGDLVFFDAATDDGTAIDHVGMFLGVDSGGHHRFISSRKSIDGPTLGDYAGRSTLNGTGLYAKAFRATRRL